MAETKTNVKQRPMLGEQTMPYHSKPKKEKKKKKTTKTKKKTMGKKKGY
tara:strand:+ start:261 stop:407 length:147 start_codon:yes stop_codon:yes gene_type:complete